MVSSPSCWMLTSMVDIWPNDGVERREVALATNEADLSRSSTPSLAHRRRMPRSFEPIVRPCELSAGTAVPILRRRYRRTSPSTSNLDADRNHVTCGRSRSSSPERDGYSPKPVSPPRAVTIVPCQFHGPRTAARPRGQQSLLCPCRQSSNRQSCRCRCTRSREDALPLYRAPRTQWLYRGKPESIQRSRSHESAPVVLRILRRP
jgi:hypothetical protein